VPLAYEIDPGGDLIRTLGTDRVSDDDLRSLMSRAAADPRIRPEMRELCDLRAVTHFDVSSAVLHEAIEVERLNGRLSGHHLAIVVSFNVTFRVARIHEMLGETHLARVAVFHDVDEAAAWLVPALPSRAVSAPRR